MNPFNGEKIRTDQEEVALRQLFVRTAVGIVTEAIGAEFEDIALPQSSVINNESDVVALSLAGPLVAGIERVDHTADARKSVREAFRKAA